MSETAPTVPGISTTAPPPAPHDHGATGAGEAAAPFFSDLLKDYVPRQACMFYESDVVWLHAFSDGLIALAYFSIPLALLYFVRRRRDLRFGWMFLLFAAFILLCGTTHLLSVVALWQAYYRLDGLVKLATGVVSMATAVALWPLIPRALALPSPSQLREANHALALEVEERRRAEAGLRQLAADLEARVTERTAELEAINEDLVREMEARRAAEEERNRLLESERQARDQAERSSKAMEAFIADLSHELRGPLHAIRGWTEILRAGEGPPSEERRRAGLDTIDRNIRVLVRLLEDLLDVNRILSGKLHLELEPVRLAPVVESAVDAVRDAARDKGVTVHLDLLEDGDWAEGDPERLQQVAMNLLSNAVKYSDEGGRVEVRLRQTAAPPDAEPTEPGWLELKVRDEGRGIPAELLPHVFERHRQTGPDDAARGGLGLGLSIVLHLVEGHGGRVRAESEGLGEGALFTVLLPRIPRPEDQAAGVTPPVDSR